MRQDKISMEHPSTTLHFSIKRGHNRIFFGTASTRTSDWILTSGTVSWTGPIRFPSVRLHSVPPPVPTFHVPTLGPHQWGPLATCAHRSSRLDGLLQALASHVHPAPSLRPAPSLGPPPLSMWAGLKSRPPARYGPIRWSPTLSHPIPRRLGSALITHRALVKHLQDETLGCNICWA
jgi:hypothetical protein